MQEEADDSLDTAVAADVAVAHSGDGCDGEVIGGEVKLKHTVLLVATSFDPGIAIYFIILKVLGNKDPEAANKVAKKQQYQEKERESLKSLADF